MSAEQDYARTLFAEIERHFIEVVEIIEGRVPFNQEIALHGQSAIYPDGTKEWKWRGRTILRMVPMRFDESGRMQPHTLEVYLP